MVRALALLLLVAGCATRQVPKTFPAGAAVNPDAKAAPPAIVGAVVRDEPPLPGEPTPEWPALSEQHAP